MWSPNEAQPELSNEWIGETRFPILHPRPKEGYEYQSGRLTKLQKTDRPPSVWPEVWNRLNTRQREREIEKWKSDAPRRKKLHKERSLGEHVPDLELPAYRR